MKKTVIATLFILVTLGLFASCKKDPRADGKVSQKSINTLTAKYPDAYDITWRTKSNYDIASFKLPKATQKATTLLRDGETSHLEAWFLSDDGSWRMTKKMEIRFEELPEAVQIAFNQSSYSQWKVDEVLCLVREGAETLYVIEAKADDHEIDLYFTEDGILIKSVANQEDDYDYEDSILDSGADFVAAFLKKNYPNARILDIDKEDNTWEVEILDGNVQREILFRIDGMWLATRTEDISLSEVPANVMEALKSSPYKAYIIEEVEHFLMPNKEFYRFELEGADDDIKVDITTTGEVSLVKEDEEEAVHRGLSLEIKKFIGEKYPNARIIDVENEGAFLEVEIYHESKKKKIYFSGADKWVFSFWKVDLKEMPDAVHKAVLAKYPDAEMEEAAYLQTPKHEYYAVFIETEEDDEILVRVTPQGKILDIEYEDFEIYLS